MKHRIALAAFAAALAAAPAAQAATKVAETYTTVTRANGSDPSDCNNLRVLKMGPSSAKNVVVLIPGFLGGSGDFRVIGRRLVPALKSKAQVWGIDRRSQCLEDTSGFKSGRPLDAYGYYFLGLPIDSAGKVVEKTAPGPKSYFTPPAIGTPGVEAARNWGLKTTLEDIRAVVLAAKTGGRKVVLGGHSLGGSLTSEYATWDFNGTAGYKDLSGMVLIDGAARGTFGAQPDLTAVNTSIAALSSGLPFSEIISGAPSYYTGFLPEVAAIYALKEPKGNSALQGALNNIGFGAFTRPIVKEAGKPDKGRLNNEGGLGYAFDRDTSPDKFQLFHMNMGSLKPSTVSGGADGWTDGGLTDLADVKQLFGIEPGNFVEWYFPKRLSIEVGAATNLSQNAVTDALGLRTWHLTDVNVPLYAFETGLTCTARPTIKPGDASTLAPMLAWIEANKSTECGVLSGARSLKDGSKITNATFVSDHNQEHLDPLVARAKDNKFQSTVTTFLKSTFGIS